MARNAHIKRIFGKNADGSDNRDVWLDLLRLDEFDFSRREGDFDYTAKIKWLDDSGEDGNQTRMTTTLKVTDPQNPPADPQNPDQYIPVDLIKQMAIRDGDQKIVYCFNNDPPDGGGGGFGGFGDFGGGGGGGSQTRKVNKKRAKHAPLIDSGVDDTLNNGNIVDVVQYQRDETQVDDADYVDAEVVVQYETNLRGAYREDADQQQINGVPLSSMFDPGGFFAQDAQPGANDDGSTPSAPVRLDPCSLGLPPISPPECRLSGRFLIRGWVIHSRCWWSRSTVAAVCLLR